MACEVLYACKGVHVGGVEVPGAKYVRIVPETEHSVDPGENTSVFDKDAVVTYGRLAVEIWGLLDLSLLALIGGVKSDVTLNILGAASGEEILTIHDVEITDSLGEQAFAEKDAGGMAEPVSGVRGHAAFAAEELFADKITAE